MRNSTKRAALAFRRAERRRRAASTEANGKSKKRKNGNVNVAIDGISIDDKLKGISTVSMRYSTTDGTLAPGEVATGTATYSITDSDIVSQNVYNVATATGNDAVTGKEVQSNEADARTDIVRNLKIGLEKTSNPTRITAEDAVVGKEIEYRVKYTRLKSCASFGGKHNRQA